MKKDVALEDVSLVVIAYASLMDVAVILVVKKDVVLVLTIRKFY